MRYPVLFIPLLILFLIPGTASGDEYTGVPSILVLHSYSQSFEWTESINQGLFTSLDAGQYELRFEYMDGKRYNRPEYLEQFAGFLEYKYIADQPDLILSVDNLAYDFLIARREILFPDVPVLAIGINNGVENRLHDVYYIIEQNEYLRTINLALAQSPAADTLHIIVDSTLTGSIIQGQLEGLLAADGTYDRLRINWIRQGSIEQLEDLVRGIDREDLLLYVLYFSDGRNPVENEQVLARIAESAPVPVYSLWSFALASGSVGGFVYDGTMLGNKAAALIAEGLESNNPDFWNGYYDRPLSRYIIDYPTAEHFDLDFGAFPPGTLFLNAPESFFRTHGAVLAVSGAIIALLSGIIVLIQINLRRQKAINRFNESLLDTQKEIMHNLSIVIERRSNETASHLKRLTGISLYIAQHFSLNRDDLHALQLGASLHDVGKVGISDSILKKAGPLNADEMEEVRTHPLKGYEILNASSNEAIRKAAVIALEHHEYWDGSGYPLGKRGRQINFLARIVTVVDVMDALLSPRSYKKPWAPERVKDYLGGQRGLMFDPRITDFVLSHWDPIYSIWVEEGEDSTDQEDTPDLFSIP